MGGDDAHYDNANDISILDPRRFTPTLHASLVAEILSLRRDLDAKHRVIEDLETNLQTTRGEKDTLSDKLSHSLRDNRSAKRQLQQLETTTLATLEELVRERDEAREVQADLREKVDAAEGRARTLEDDARRAQNLWESDKNNWDGEKRQLERRVHVAESRLKVVLDEFEQQHLAAAAAAAASVHERRQSIDHESEVEDGSRDSGLGHESDSNSTHSPSRQGSIRQGRPHARNVSISSLRRTPSLRMSLRSGSALDYYIKTNGISLADELVFDEEDEDYLEYAEDDVEEYPEHELRARRALESRQSAYHDDKAKRVLGLMSADRSGMTDSPTKTRSNDQAVNGAGMGGISMMHHEYVDMGVQCTPPQSPENAEAKKQAQRSFETASPTPEHGANQRRKRTSASILVDRAQSPAAVIEIKPAPVMVTTACQTIEEIPTPEAIQEKFFVRPETPPPTPPAPVMITSSTQTDVQ